MTKEQLLELIKLLSALESWSFSAGQRISHEQPVKPNFYRRKEHETK